MRVLPTAYLVIPWRLGQGVHLSFKIFLIIFLAIFLPLDNAKMTQNGSPNSTIWGNKFSTSQPSLPIWTCGNLIDIEFFASDISNNMDKKPYHFCYVSMLASDNILGNLLGIKISRRFKMSMSTSITNPQNMWEDCKNCINENGKKWNCVKLNWNALGEIKMRSSLLNGDEMEVSNFVNENYFNGKFKEFLIELMKSDGRIYKGTTNLLMKDGDGEFLEDLVKYNVDEYLFALHFDLALSLSLLEHFSKSDNTASSICVDGNSSLFIETKMEKCRKRVDKRNKEYGYNRSEVSDYACLMDQNEKQFGGAIPTPNPDGKTMEWGGPTAHGELEIPEEESIEEERKRMHKIGTVRRSQLSPPPSKNGREKRDGNGNIQPDVDAECIIYGNDIADKWPGCEYIINNIRDQGKCNSSWAVATAAALTDRCCIFLSKKKPGFGFRKIETNRFASARDAMECAEKSPKNCFAEGGSQANVWKYYVEQSTVNDKCKPYISESPRNDWTEECHHQCDIQTDPDGSLDLLRWGDPNLSARNFGAEKFNEKEWMHLKRYASILYRPTNYYILHANKYNERIMKKEIDTNGTIVAGMFIYDYADFNEANTRSNTTTIYTCPMARDNPIDYIAVRIIGYGQIDCLGETMTRKYWLVANSKGLQWGNQGMFKIARGNDDCGIESDISWGELTAFPYNN